MGRNERDFCPFLFPSAIYGSPSSSPSSTPSSPPSSPPPTNSSSTQSSSHHTSSSLSITSPFKLYSSTADGANLNPQCTEEITVDGSSNTINFPQDAVNEIQTSSTTKQSKRNRTMLELKEEESLLLKDRTNLKIKLETLRHTLEDQRAANESLKKFKCGNTPVTCLRSHQKLRC
ncbi:uncharacterized protein LOC126660759 isoform X1 [Mercurialis annua]|uniref:uncharacterized protein LOC126660759 isoform X1 n=1 Tax=Mercurialis annua TaxID=3986 RepID=UPI00215E0261|nr:uncharacterized protein LOC126660759 isoform X1 [Mercurialis annua]